MKEKIVKWQINKLDTTKQHNELDVMCNLIQIANNQIFEAKDVGPNDAHIVVGCRVGHEY